MPTDAIEETNTANTGLTYDASTQTYQYNWKSDKSLAGKCGRFDLGVGDGRDTFALFKMK